ncbi:c-type cytochrome [Algihabitans albus]|uniref:c-type cytochrome n=1 Tax=Algihabitans albus TaxID=2164067 RepID=UPI0013C2A5A4|nr:c-type cytochrome [Algihabitans albus]
MNFWAKSCALLGLAAAFSIVSPGSPAWAELLGHGGFVKGVAVAPDGKRALTGSFDYTVILWDLPEQRALQVLDAHQASVNAVALLPNERAVSASDDGTLRVWDTAAGREVAVLEGHEGKVQGLAVSADGTRAASAGWDGSVRLWDLQALEPLGVFEGHRSTVNAVAFSPSGEQLLSAGFDLTLRIWRVSDGTQLGELSGGAVGFTSAVWLPDERHAVTTQVDGSVRLWDLETGTEVAQLGEHPEASAFALAVSPDGRLAASAGTDRVVRLWDLETRQPAAVLDGHLAPIWSLAFFDDGKKLISGGADEVARVWDLEQGTEIGVSVASGARPLSDLATADPSLERGAEVFRKCSVCHDVQPGASRRAGPTLHGVFGRPAGAVADYNYSPALTDTEIVWNAETISQLFDEGPDIMTPGTKMPIQRIPNAEDRAALMRYLEVVTE